MRRLALPAFLFAALSGCLSTPPSGVISCDNNCPITGFYCAADGFCWMNGEYPTSTSSAAASSAAAGGSNGSSGSGSGGSGSSAGTAKATAATGSSTGQPSGTGSSGTSAGKN